jgi:hypothetical protein
MADARETEPIASLATREGAQEVAQILRANGIRCAVVGPPELHAPLMYVGRLNTSVVIDPADEAAAREALQGIFACAWFLRTPDGRAYHAFEAATPAVLRAHVEHHADPDAFTTRQVAYLADLVDQLGQPTVYEAFREHRRLRPDRTQPVLGMSLDDWAEACGCAHVHVGAPSEVKAAG